MKSINYSFGMIKINKFEIKYLMKGKVYSQHDSDAASKESEKG